VIWPDEDKQPDSEKTIRLKLKNLIPISLPAPKVI
jgi:hypothetical protein